MSFPNEKYAPRPAGAGQPQPLTQSRPLPSAGATDARLSEQPWASAPPSSVLLNIRLNANRAKRLMDLGIGLVERDAERQHQLDRARVQQAQAQHGAAAAACVLNRYGRQDAAGGKQIDTGIKDELHALAGGQPVCLDRIWWDLENRLGMRINNAHLMQKEGDQGFFLRLYFSPADQPSTAPSGLFFWDYFRSHLHEGATDPAKAEAALIAELDDVQKRLYKQAFRYRNPNLTWTVNTGQVFEGNAERYHRVRLLPAGKFALEATEMPSFRRRSVEPPPPAA